MDGWPLIFLLVLPVAGAGVCLLLNAPKGILAWVFLCVLASAGAAGAVIAQTLSGHVPVVPGEWLLLDALSAYHLGVLMLVFLLSSFYAIGYFRHGIDEGKFTRALARRYGSLYLGSMWAMIVVLLSNNLGILWVGIEASTLLTAFLICIPVTPASLEAMWKYLIMCSVGVAFAFIGTLLVAASAVPLHLPSSQMLLWTHLQAGAGSLDVSLLKLGFLFLLIGYGTKAGLAPMHNWLPDAHSQAPAPVSAVFSGILLNTALYCVLRYLPIAEKATGSVGWARQILVVLGLISILVSSAFILFQRDAKRLLAYSSVEHIGIMTLAVGLGGLGTFAALLHMLNHSLGKSLAFFSAGRLGQMYGGYDMTQMTSALRRSRTWGGGFFLALMALIGVAPFAIFLSELLVLKAAFDAANWAALVLFLAGTAVVFVGALRMAVGLTGGTSTELVPVEKGRFGEGLLVVCCLGGLLLLGTWVPGPLWKWIDSAAAIVRGTV